MVPLPHGAIAKEKVGEGVDEPGMVTVATSDSGQLVSFPTVTSEYWYANCAVDEGAMATAVGPASAAGGERSTDRPFTMVTVMGAPLPDMRPIVG